MKIKLTKLLLFTQLIWLSSCGQTAQKNSAVEIQKGWKSLNENNYSIQYPEEWNLNQSGQMGMSFILLSKQTSQQDQFRDNVNLLIQDLTGYNLNLDKYLKISEEQIKSMITNSRLIENKRIDANGKSFQKVIYTGDQGIYKLKFEQYYWVKNNKAYVLSLTCEVDQFDAYQAIGEKIMNSFQFD